MNSPSLLTEENWQQINLFFMQQGNIYNTLNNLHKHLSEANITYAVIGGMALALHGYRRLTEDIDLLMNSDDLEKFRNDFLGRGYIAAFTGAQKTFKNTITGVRIEVITTGEFPGDGKPKSVCFPDPQEVTVELGGLKVINLENLIELKLASGLSAPDRLKDLADVQELIRILNLSESLAEKLDSSVRSEYLRLWSAIYNR
ncbi:MAG: nucleotidyltransferase family protein [Cyanobacteria bacterium P01_E01_bin.42]